MNMFKNRHIIHLLPSWLQQHMLTSGYKRSAGLQPPLNRQDTNQSLPSQKKSKTGTAKFCFNPSLKPDNQCQNRQADADNRPEYNAESSLSDQKEHPETPQQLKASQLDLSRLSELHKLGHKNGHNVLQRSIKYFLDKVPQNIKDLHNALDTGNIEDVRMIAHNLKSGSATLGAMHFSEYCLQLETAARKDQHDNIIRLIESIEENVPQVLAALNDILQEPQFEESTQTLDQPDTGRILLVDDDAGFRLTTCDALRGAGFVVDEADSGKQALLMIDKNLPDLILLDALMPEMDGFEVCQCLKKNTSTPTIPVMMVTGLDDMDSVNRAFKSGADSFANKPLNHTILIHRLRFQLRAAKDALALRESKEQLASAQRMAKLGYWRWNAQTDEFIVSDQFTTMFTSKARKDCKNIAHYLEYIHPDDRKSTHDSILSALGGVPTEATNLRIISDNKCEIIVHQEIALTTDSDHIVLGTVQDITQQHDAEQRIRQLAYFDELTGIASRPYFYQHINNQIKSAARRHEKFSLLYLDLDGFKDINDSLGHNMGDKLLITIAQRLQKLIHDSDFVARLSGDEFCIFIDSMHDEYEAAALANQALHEINQPLDLGTQTVHPRCSIGIARYPEDGKNLHELLKAADSAMYAAKAKGKHRYAFYYPDLTTQAETRLQMEQDLRLAIERNELELFYQPQVELRSGKMVGVEALIRWNHPKKGLISPADFIPIAERIGLIKVLGDWVLRTACTQAVSWRNAGLPKLQMAVNISPTHFQDPVLITSVKEILKETGMHVADLELEVTESVVQTTGKNVDMFNRLREMGLKIAIDDFGTGYSSLSSLKYLPIDCLKIDRIFIIDMLNDPESSIILGAIANVSHALGYTIVAEGVEEYEQVVALNGFGCEMIQGYYFSRPVPADKIPSLAQRDFMAASTKTNINHLLPGRKQSATQPTDLKK